MTTPLCVLVTASAVLSLACPTTSTSVQSVTVGDGLVATGTSDVTIDVSFAGSGAQTTVARSDHTHDGTYLPVGSTLACSPGQFVSSVGITGDVTCQTPYTDAQAVAALTAASFSHSLFYGAASLRMMQEGGTPMTCYYLTNLCVFAQNLTTELYVPIVIPSPATLVQLTCTVNDVDATSGNMVVMRVYHGSSQLGSAVLSTTIGDEVLSVPVNLPVTGSEAWYINVTGISGVNPVAIRNCKATYTTTGSGG